MIVRDDEHAFLFHFIVVFGKLADNVIRDLLI